MNARDVALHIAMRLERNDMPPTLFFLDPLHQFLNPPQVGPPIPLKITDVNEDGNVWAKLSPPSQPPKA